MKTLLFIWAGILLLGCSGISIPSPTPKSKAISVMADVSDKMKEWPSAQELLLLYNLPANPEQECLFRLRSISDRMLVPIYSCHLPSAAKTETENIAGDNQFRNKRIVNFYEHVKKKVALFYRHIDTTKTTERSLCFQSICDELQFLAASSYEQKEIVIFSNLFENSTLFNVYNSSVCDTVLNNPKYVVQKLKALNLLPSSLKDITIIFVFSPATTTEDLLYTSMAVHIYKQLFVSYGAEVKVQATLEGYMNL